MLDAAESTLQFLLASGKVSQESLSRARRLAGDAAEVVTLALSRLGLVSEQDVALAFATTLNLQVASDAELNQAILPTNGLTTAFLQRHHVLPLDVGSEKHLTLAMSNPADEYAVQAVELATGRTVHRAVALPTSLDQVLDRLCVQDIKQSAEPIPDQNRHHGNDASSELERLREAASGAPVIRLVNQLLGRTVDERASDLHLEPTAHGLSVRSRVDGLLQSKPALGIDLRDAVVSRVKLMAGLDIAERRLPQDGRFGLAVRGRDVDFRIATIPTQHGESVVVRVLDREQQRLSLSDVGLDDGALKQLRALLNLANGLILVTGPTGSGKTTTLYAGLNFLNTTDRKLMTVEDPIEYQIAGVQQVQIQDSIGLSFSCVLRSFLRHNPNIVMVGEIRDQETAQIAVRVALTGHLVLSTLHTNSAASGLTRLLDMGVEDYLLTSTCKAILSQRLVRLLCTECREAYKPELSTAICLGRQECTSAPVLYRARGCGLCNGTGFRGRTTILEIMPLSDAIRTLVLQRASALEVERLAVAEGMRTMSVHGMEKVTAGLTTIDEVLRAVDCEG